MKAFASCCAFALLAFPLGDARAAAPLFTDDARILEPGSCQLEAWVRRNRESTESWALPACNFTGHFDLTVGGVRVREDGASAFRQTVLQLKTVLRPLAPDSWGVGLVVGTVRHLKRERATGWPGDAYVNIPLSFASSGEDYLVHLNAGAAHDRAEKRSVATWGVGGEIRLRDDLSFNPEIFRSERGRPFYQAGLRYAIVKDRLQMDATYGNRAVSETGERWFSIGLRVLSPPFLQ